MSDNDITRKIRTHVDDADTEGNIRQLVGDAETELRSRLDDADTEGNLRQRVGDAETALRSRVEDAEGHLQMKRPRPATIDDADVEGHVRFRNEGPVDDAPQLRAP